MTIEILDGSDYVSTEMVVQGLNLLSSGKVKRFVIVLHRIARLHRPYGLNADYANLVGKELQDHGLKETDCFTEYELDQWWEKYPGIRDFGTEALKLAYYLVGGYIPLKLSY